MLQIITPNSELASLLNPRSSLDGCSVQFDAESDDFKSEVIIHCRYAKKANRPYHIFFFCRNDLSDNDIYDVMDKSLDSGIGLLTPVRSLCTKEHTKAQDEYFEAVAGAVFWHLIEDAQNVSIAPFADDEYDISEFYDENVAVLVVNKAVYPEFDINRYLPTLFSYGYSPYKRDKYLSDTWRFRDLPKGKTIRILPVSERCLGDRYIESLYQDLLPFEGNALAQFMLQYQVFEMLMHVVFTKKIDEIKTEVNSFTGTASDLRDVLDKVGKISKERDRIKGSIEASKLPPDTTNQLSDACSRLLSGAGKDCEGKHCADLVYDVRNLVFHNFRSIPEDKRDILRELNNELIKILPKLLASA